MRFVRITCQFVYSHLPSRSQPSVQLNECSSYPNSKMAMYDAKKRSEYKFRLLLSIILFVIIIFALSYKGGDGPAATELTLIGFAFCFGSFGHSAWALRQIKKTQERPDK